MRPDPDQRDHAKTVTSGRNKFWAKFKRKHPAKKRRKK
jgi:hypothetical protein